MDFRIPFAVMMVVGPAFALAWVTDPRRAPIARQVFALGATLLTAAGRDLRIKIVTGFILLLLILLAVCTLVIAGSAYIAATVLTDLAGGIR